MYKILLVPLDGSKRAEAILPHIEFIARSSNAQVIFLRVEEPPVMLGRDEVIDIKRSNDEFESRKKAAKDYLEGLKDAFSKKGIQVDVRVLFGSVVKTILEVAEKVHADLIAMASHGVGGSQRMFYGSVTAGILQRIDRPLLIIRTRNTF